MILNWDNFFSSLALFLIIFAILFFTINSQITINKSYYDELQSCKSDLDSVRDELRACEKYGGNSNIELFLIWFVAIWFSIMTFLVVSSYYENKIKSKYTIKKIKSIKQK